MREQHGSVYDATEYLREFYIHTPNVATAVVNRIRETSASNLVSALLTGFPWFSSVPVGKCSDFN
jgi:hypothetical protein